MDDKEYKNELYQYAVQMRHWLHQNPELSMQEYKTTEFICGQLEKMGCDIVRWPDFTGAVGTIRGAYPGPTIAIRADIDALPIEEQSKNPYPSQVKGVMHACAHDGHTAIVLAVGKYFARYKEKLTGNVKLIFQPGEEVMPGGAKGMIERGVLQDPRADVLFGLHHVWMLEAGEIGVYPCEALIGVSRFKITLRADGSSCYDGIQIATELMKRIYDDQPINFGAGRPISIVFGKISGGIYAGDFANEVIIEGVGRTFSLQAWEQLPKFLQRYVSETADKAKLEYTQGYPPVYNDFDASWLVKEAAAESVGDAHVKIVKGPLEGSDDMAFFLREVPGCYFWWGIAPKDGKKVRAHTPDFDFDDEVMIPAIDTMIGVVRKALGHYKRESV